MPAGLRPSCTKSHETRACSRPSSTRNQEGVTSSIRTKPHESSACPCPTSRRNQVGGTSSIRYGGAQKESLSSSVRYEESRWWDFAYSIRSHAKGGLVLVRQVQRIMQVGLRPSGTTSREWRASPPPSGMRNQAGKSSSVRYEVERKKGLSSSVQYEESSRLYFVRPVRSHTKRELFLVLPVQGMK